MVRETRVLILALALMVVASAAQGGRDKPLFRPLTADPRENQFRMKFVDYTEDWRFGTDISDPASLGGHEERSDVSWDVGMGGTVRFDPLESLAWFSPWKACQISLPAGVYANFDRVGSELVNADYQFGVALDMAWTGDVDASVGVRDFDQPYWVTHLSVFHRSTHLGDEYLALGDFGANQQGHPAQGDLFAHPPVKRVNLSFEALRMITSVEWAPRAMRPGTLRVYAGGELKLDVANRLQPRNFNSPIGQLGLEIRTAANAPAPRPTWPAAFLNGLINRHTLTGEWMFAADLKLARPFNFASCDNPTGEAEVWTPNLWSECPCGREFREYAGSWHATLGHVFYLQSHRNDEGSVPQRIGPEFIVALEWYRGYSPNGQFLDQRLRYRPLGYVVPGVIMHF